MSIRIENSSHSTLGYTDGNISIAVIAYIFGLLPFS